jgi:hypothetical protein
MTKRWVLRDDKKMGAARGQKWVLRDGKTWVLRDDKKYGLRDDEKNGWCEMTK